MKNKIHLIGAAILMAPLMSAGISGNWIAQIPIRQGIVDTVSSLKADGKKLTGMRMLFTETVFYFRAEGKELTGTVTTPYGKTAISEGKISGNEISFTVIGGFTGNKGNLKYRGKVGLNEIRFTVKEEGGEEQTLKFIAKREFQPNQDIPLQPQLRLQRGQQIIIDSVPKD